MDGIIAYILSKKYTNDTVIGMGAIKGAACQVQSINKVNKTTTITLEWEDNLGTSHTQSFDIEDGLDGVSVTGAIIKPDGHLELTLSNGTTIDCGKVLPQYDTMPTPSSSNEGQILQYIGTTTSSYTNGYFYECINDGGTYKWVEKLVQDSYTKIQIGDLSNLPDNTKNVVENIVDIDNKLDDKENIFRYNVIPTADVSISGAIIQYLGATNATYTNGYYYQCVESPVGSGTYVWVQKNVQPNNGGGGGDGVVDGYYNSADQLFYEDSAFLNPITGEDNTIYVDLNTNGLYRYDGTIFIKVSSSAESIQVTTLPTADVTQLDKIYQYIGVTDTNYTKGYFYRCILDGSVYKWVEIPTQDSYTKAQIGQLSDLPDPSKTVIENIDLINGSVLNIKTDITNIQGSLADIDKDKLNDLAPIYLIGSGLILDTTVGSPTYGKLQATGMSIPVDDKLDASSLNPVQNKVITLTIDQLQGSVLNKIQKMLGAQEDNFTVIDNNGGVKDSGISKDVVPITASASNKLLVASDLSTYQKKLTEGDGIDIDTNNKISIDISYLTASRVGYIPSSEKGAHSGVAELDSTGKVPSSQLPSYVDDVIDGYYNDTDGKFYEESTYTTEIVGESGKIYISVDTDIQYRWTGTAFAALGGALQLGETSSTAYRGDRGKIAYDHSQIKDGSNPHNTTADNVNLKVPIPALSGSKLDVESTLYGINTELGKKQNIRLTTPISMLSGTKLEVEPALQCLNDEKQNIQLTVPIDTLGGTKLTVEDTLNEFNTEIKGIDTDLDGKADLTDLAPEFDTTIAYTTGQYVIYNGDVYRFRADHSAGVWIGTDATKVDIGGELLNKVSYDFNAKTGVHQLMPLTLAKIKALNTSSAYSWNNNVCTINNTDITFTVDANGYVTDIQAIGTPSADSYISLFSGTLKADSYKWSGCPVGGASNTYATFCRTSDTTSAEFGYDTGDGKSFTITQNKTINYYIKLSTASSAINLTFKPLLKYAEDFSNDYTDYAMTNAELTKRTYSMYPTPDVSLDEATVVSSINTRYNSPTNNEVPSVYDISRYSNEKKVRRVLNGANIPSGTSMTTTGIGTWTDKAIDQITSADETDWWYDSAFVVPVYYMLTSDTSIVTGKTYYTRSGTAPNYTYTVVANPVVSDIGTYYEQYSDDVDISVKFDPSGDTATLGGYIFDSTTGKICIKFGNSITVNTARIAVDITYTRNEVG